MSAICHVRRSVAVAGVATVLAWAQVSVVDAQQASVQQLLERGALEEAVQRAHSDRNSETTYLAAQALGKLENRAGANEEYGVLRETGDAAWKAIGESGAAVIAGDLAGAMEAAERAVAANAENAYAHYQVGLVASRQNDYQRASQAFTRSVELKPDLAYGHYYAGLAFQRLRQTPKMSEHLEAFMRLAPDAPERAAVAAILRTLRG